MHSPGAVTESKVVLVPMPWEKARSPSSVQGGVYQPDGSPPAFSSAEVDISATGEQRDGVLAMMKIFNLTLTHGLWIDMMMHIYFGMPGRLIRRSHC